jgi:hypothetical protein
MRERFLNVKDRNAKSPTFLTVFRAAMSGPAVHTVSPAEGR